MVPDTSEPMPSALCNRLDLNMIRAGGRLAWPSYGDYDTLGAKADASWKEPNK